MSLRRVRKKKILDMANEEQEAAKERLFEISYFDDGKVEDRSEVLMHHRHEVSMLPTKERLSPRKQRKEVVKKKSNSLAIHKNLILPLDHYEEETSSVRGLSKIRATTLGQSKSIVNTIESNKVFVGNKKYNSARTNTDVAHAFSITKKGGEPMSILKPKSFVQLQKIKHSPTHMIQPKFEYHFPKSERWKLAQLLTNKNADRISYIQIKTKLKRELLGGTEQRLTRKYDFFT